MYLGLVWRSHDPRLWAENRRWAPRLMQRGARLRLLSCLDLCSNQTDLVDTGGVRDIDDLGNTAERNVVIPFHEHHLFGAGREDVTELALESIPVGFSLVDLERRPFRVTPLEHLDHDGAFGR